MLPSQKHQLLLIVLLVSSWTADGVHNGSEAEVASPVWPTGLSSSRHITAKEGSSILIECNVTGGHSKIEWYNTKGPLMGEKWQIQENGDLNITVLSFEDRGSYTCVASNGTGETKDYTITLRVAHTDSGLGLYFVIVCLVAFTITMILNVALLCMVSSHLKKMERAINEFFRTEGPEKLQKAFEVAKQIPIVTSAKTLEFAKVTQFKTIEFARHMEELARSIPLPPLILNCRAYEEDVVEMEALEPSMPVSVNRPALGLPTSDMLFEREKVCQALLSSEKLGNDDSDVNNGGKVSEDNEVEMC